MLAYRRTAAQISRARLLDKTSSFFSVTSELHNAVVVIVAAARKVDRMVLSEHVTMRTLVAATIVVTAPVVLSLSFLLPLLLRTNLLDEPRKMLNTCPKDPRAGCTYPSQRLLFSVGLVTSVDSSSITTSSCPLRAAAMRGVSC